MTGDVGKNIGTNTFFCGKNTLVQGKTHFFRETHFLGKTHGTPVYFLEHRATN